jgi:hypothetical protein
MGSIRQSRAFTVTGITLLSGVAAACGGRWTDERNVSATAGAGSGGTVEIGVSPAGAPGKAAADDSSVLLIPTDGWVDGKSNALMVQGAMYAHGDSVSAPKMTSDFSGTNSCIRGSIGPVILDCQPTDCCKVRGGAQDCSSTLWIAGISLNFGQRKDPTTMLPDTVSVFNANALVGFSFELSGRDLPAPQSLSFEVQTYRATYGAAKALGPGINTILLNELRPFDSLEHDKTSLVRISWLLNGRDSAEVSYDFCVSNVRALLK